MTGKNDQKSNDKIPSVKRRKRWFFRTPAGALDSLTFCLFWIKNLENQNLLSQILLVKNYKILHDMFSGKSPIFKKYLGFSRNRPFFKKNGHFLKNSSFFKKPSIFWKRVGCFSSKMMGKMIKNRVTRYTSRNVENDAFIVHPLARSTA